MNQEIAKILSELAVLLDIKAVPFKPRAYERAAFAIGSLSEDVQDIYRKGGRKALEEIPGVGSGIGEKIEQYLKTHRIKQYEALKKEFPVDITDLRRVEGVGPALIKKLYQGLKIKDTRGLKNAAQRGQIRHLAGLGEKTEQRILKSIGFLKKSRLPHFGGQPGGRYILGFILPLARRIRAALAAVPGVRRTEFAGSVRRMQETVGDLDFLVISDQPEKAMECFVKLPEVDTVISRGPTRTSVRLNIGIDADIRVIAPESFGAALQYFTGDKYHNIAVREIAVERGYKLNEYGLFRGRKLIAAGDEKEIYAKLGLTWMPPELRTNQGEITAAQEDKLPELIDYRDLKGDLQVQTDWTDGEHSIKTMAEAAKQQGLAYICITDHTRSLAMTGGLDEKQLVRQMAEIDKVNRQIGSFKILKGAEVNIYKDGTLDIKDETLAQLDVVGAAVHSNFNLPEKEMTARISRAMENSNVDIIFHPTGRLIQKREPYQVDMTQLIKTAKRTKTILEVNAYPERLDLKGEYIRLAVAAGVKLAVNSDAHSAEHFKYLELGVGQARRGWAEKKDVINTGRWQDMVKLLK